MSSIKFYIFCYSDWRATLGRFALRAHLLRRWSSMSFYECENSAHDCDVAPLALHRNLGVLT